MSNLENIKNRILEDAKISSEEILRTAREDELRLIESREKEARVLERQQLDRAKRESSANTERMISSAQLKVRNDKLAAKQKVIEDIFERAINALNTMDRESFEDYLVSKIAPMDISGEETLILSKEFISDLDKEKKDKETSTNNLVKIIKNKVTNTSGVEGLIKRINNELKSKGKNGNISVSKVPGDFQGGFILEKDGVHINNTFEALVNSMRDEMEYEVAKILFE